MTCEKIRFDKFEFPILKGLEYLRDEEKPVTDYLFVNQPDETAVQLEGVVESQEYYGLYIKYYIHVGSQVLKVIEKNDGINIYAPGEKVTVAIHVSDVMSYPAEKQ